MGLKDRWNSAKALMWSPMEVNMVDLGSDKLVRSGAPAKVVVVVSGEDDGTPERIEVYLRLSGWGREGYERMPLGEVPTELGTHELQVEIPAGLPPSCLRYVEYTFGADLHRTRGTGSSAASVVDVVGRPKDLYWPEGGRTGCDGPASVSIAIELDAETVNAGETLTGRVVVVPEDDIKETVELELGTLIDALVQVAGKSQPQPRVRFKAVRELALAERRRIGAAERLKLPFSVEVPEGLPPTLHNGGKTSVVWQVRVAVGRTVAWRNVGVLDPEGAAGCRNQASPTLAGFLDGL